MKTGTAAYVCVSSEKANGYFLVQPQSVGLSNAEELGPL
jgi:hypothetical protein